MNNRKQISLIVVLTLLCLFAGAWLLLFDKQFRTDGSNGKNDADITAETETIIRETGTRICEEAKELVSDWMLADRVYSHRGSAGSKEHSFEAYDEAIEAGSHNIEQDVVVSRDGTLYVSHDESAARLTGVNRDYSDMSDDEISEITTYDGSHILKLSEVFEHYGKNVKYIVELRNSDDMTIGGFSRLVDTYELENNIIAQSFEEDVLDALETVYPEMPKIFLCKTQDAVNRSTGVDSADIVSVRVNYINDSTVESIRNAGKKFSAWPLDSDEEIKLAISYDADSYFTNETARALELERKYRSNKTSDHSTLFFASDYQQASGFDAPKDTLSALLAAAASDGKVLDGIVICGDFTNEGNLYNYQLSPDDSISEIKAVMSENAPQVTNDKMIFVQGNHDAMGDLISSSGLHEYDNYLIYVLNTEDDFPWSQGKTSGSYDKVRKAAEEMRNCFDGLIEKGETKTVFIAGHVPLHYSARTSSRHTTGDNLYSSLIFDVVNDAAKSLDIVYVHGHNHSKGWDCYMGGAAAYKAVGDSILIPVFNDGDVTTDKFEERELNFTYMNAGYSGYYMNCAPSDYDVESYKAADETLSATVCEVYEDRIEITRYDSNGRHVLGAEGAANPYKGGIDEGLIGPEYYSKETESPATIKRNAADDALDEAA